VRTIPRYRVLTPRSPGRYSAIGLLTLDGVAAESLAAYLMKEHEIFTAVLNHPAVQGVRVTPGLPTSQAHIDRLLDALHAAQEYFA
jgi:selenocysteine lyase/cysteine desulfurase